MSRSTEILFVGAISPPPPSSVLSAVLARRMLGRDGGDVELAGAAATSGAVVSRAVVARLLVLVASPPGSLMPRGGMWLVTQTPSSGEEYGGAGVRASGPGLAVAPPPPPHDMRIAVPKRPSGPGPAGALSSVCCPPPISDARPLFFSSAGRGPYLARSSAAYPVYPARDSRSVAKFCEMRARSSEMQVRSGA